MGETGRDWRLRRAARERVTCPTERGSAFGDERGRRDRARACIRGGLGALHPSATHTSVLRDQNAVREKKEKLAR